MDRGTRLEELDVVQAVAGRCHLAHPHSEVSGQGPRGIPLVRIELEELHNGVAAAGRHVVAAREHGAGVGQQFPVPFRAGQPVGLQGSAGGQLVDVGHLLRESGAEGSADAGAQPLCPVATGVGQDGRYFALAGEAQVLIDSRRVQ
jgi:hypothetical protein